LHRQTVDVGIIMPVTPYHFGPSGFVWLVFRKWIDLPVFLLANVIIDVEVLFAERWEVHRHWHFHTFLVGGAVCAAGAVVAYPARHLFKKIMHRLYLPYETSFWKMVFSGILGGWFHVFIDSIYHYDIQPFWPGLKNPFWRLLSHGQVKAICIATLAVFAAWYVITVIRAQKTGRSIQERKLY